MVGVGGALVIGAAATGLVWMTATAATLALVVGIVALLVRRPARPLAWSVLMLSVSPIVFARLSVAMALEPLGVGRDSPFGDIRAVVFYVTLALGLLLLGGRTAQRNLADALDATIVALGVFLLMWLFLLGGAFVLSATSPVAALVRPIAVAILSGILTRLLFVVERPTPSFWLLVAATVCALVGLVVTIGHDLRYPFTTTLEHTGAWFAAYTVLVTAALLHPSSAAPLATRQRGTSRFSVTRIVVFVALTLLGPLAWVLAVVPSPFNPASLRDFGVPVVVAALISLLLVLRLALINQLADRLRSELAYRAAHDPLTGLGNRAELVNWLDTVVGRRGDRGGRAALLLLDLDGFKDINDTFGHPVGDELLVEVGKRLSSLELPASTVVRLGGDEFAVLLSDVDEASARAGAEMVRDRLSEPYIVSRGRMTITASVGVCVTPRVEKSSSEVLRDADLALYSAKAAGKNRVRVFDNKLNDSRRQRSG